MDEPQSRLDPLMRESIINYLFSYVELKDRTVILSTHEMAEVDPLVDSVMVVQNGEVRGIAEIDNIRNMHGQGLVDWVKKIISDDEIK